MGEAACLHVLHLPFVQITHNSSAEKPPLFPFALSTSIKLKVAIYSILRLKRLGKGIPFPFRRAIKKTGDICMQAIFFLGGGGGRGNNLKHLGRFPSNKKSGLKF